ncbi:MULTISPECIES: FadR/GntR family transcriptional regulator [unclassified Mesorhizobium]|uniref:FadR/GntR family transcriptional regulator n=1 Tax=unclassified Mesorhizobium TaxID=325217 RepID=UPI001CCAABFF|nr:MULTISPECIES: FCD domain-containing protein [unclassified Mesorhizobium]MBZ9738944.1 FCD domain-containing protein [Mesorhizobium sp. CO1-1-4]MBZ9802753.1 FCD domain-containing protein [Mesorhizobium sp. ES1-6]
MPKLVASDIATALKKRISSGEWIENGRIPPERDLAREFGVARNTMRRAVSFLEDEGTVVRHVGRGTFLTATNPASMAAVVGRMEGTSPADMMEIRQLLEPAAASFAATNASAMELNAVREAHRIACEAQDMPTFEHWDAEFHHRIFACSRNEFLKEIHNLMRILRNQAPWFEMKKRSFSEERRGIYCSEHQTVLDVLLRRDPESASQAMLAHLKTVERNLLGR